MPASPGMPISNKPLVHQRLKSDLNNHHRPGAPVSKPPKIPKYQNENSRNNLHERVHSQDTKVKEERKVIGQGQYRSNNDVT